MWLFAKWCPVLLVFTLYFWCIFLAYSLRDFILIPYQNLLDLIWVVRTIICLSNKKESVLLMPCIFIAPDDKMLNSNNLSLNYSQNKKQDQIQKKKKANKQKEIWKCRDKMTWSHPTIRASFYLLNCSAEKEVQPESLQVFEVAAAWTCFLLSKWFLGRTHPLIDKQMVISEPSMPNA